MSAKASNVCMVSAATLLVLATLAHAQSTRTYTYNNVGNRTNATNQVRFTSAAGFSIDPLDALVGQRVNLYGRNFPGGREADVTITVGGATATIVSAGSRVITFTMPAGAQTGDVVLSIVGGPQNQIVGRITLRGVSVAPNVAELGYSESTTFTAQAIGATNTTVTWRVNNIAGGNGSVGTITAAGVYTAPNLGTGIDYPYVVSAFNAELNMTGYALVKPRCNVRTTIANRTIVNGTFATSSIRHCYEFTGVAGEYAFVAMRSEVAVQSVTLRDADGVTLAATSSGTNLRLPDVLLPTAGTYQIEVLGNASTFGPYEIYVDRHPALARGVWLSPFSGTWQTPGNWSRGELPQATDAVTIGNFNPDLTVTMSSGTQSCAAITSGERLEITGGNLTVAGPMQVNERLRLGGGRLRSAIVVPSSGGHEAVLDGGMFLDSVVFTSGTAIRHTGTAYIERGVTCDGTWNVDGGSILFQDSNSLLGTGNIYLGSQSAASIYAATGVSMTLGSSVAIRVTSGTIGNTDSSFIALGVIHAVQAGGTLNLRGVGWENRGVIDAVAGTTVNTFGTWDNNGLLRTTNATLNLGGTFRFGDLGNCQHVGGVVNLTGTLDNTTSTLVLTPSMQNWRVNGGTIRGGEIETQAPAQLLFEGNGTLDGVRLKPGAVARLLGAVTATARNGLTIDGTFYVNNGGLLAATTQTFGGTGLIDVGSGSTGYLYAANGATLTLGPGLNVRVGTGHVGWSGDSIRNQGTIRGDRQGGNLYLDGASWRNEGLVEGQNGCAVNVRALASTNVGTMTQVFGSLNFAGTWSNSGTINAGLATVTLGGTFSLSTLGVLNAAASEVVITGALQNTPDLILSATTGSWKLRGGSITNCRIATLDATELLCDGNSTFRDVTIQNSGSVRVVSVTLNVRGNLTVNGSLVAHNAGVQLLDDNTQVQGSGTVTLGPGTGYLYSPNTVNWTLAAGTTVRALSGYVGYTAATFTNRGTIRCDVANGTAWIGATNSWSNLGTILASNGGRVQTQSTWSNGGTMTVGHASVLLLDGQFTNSGLGTWTNVGGEVWLLGTLTNSGILNLAGTWNVRGGTIVGGRLQTAAAAELLFDGNGTLDNVTIDPGARVRTVGTEVTVRNGLVVNGLVSLGSGNLRIATNGLVLSGSGTIELSSPSATSYIYSSSAITWAIESGLAVRCTGHGQLGSTSDTFVNRGLISAEGPNRLLTLLGSTWDNRGKVHVFNNCTLRLDGTDWRNSTGSIVQTNGTIELRGTFGRTALGSFTPNGGEVHVVGTCDVAGGTLTLNPPTTGTWRMRGGTLRNGMLGGTELLFDGTGTLDGMTLAAGAIARAINGNTIRVLNGLTNLGTIRLDYGYLQMLTNNSTLGGSGMLEMGNSTGGESYVYGTTNVAWTIGTGQVIRALGSGLIGGGATNENVINQGAIQAQCAMNRTLRINGSPSFDNRGTILCNTSTATLRFEGTNWRNTTGTITHQNGTLQLGGTFPSTALGAFSSTGGEVHLIGICDVGAGTLTMNAATIGSWRMRNGTLRSTTQNGVLASTVGSELLVDGTGTLDGMSVAANSLVRVTGGNVLYLRSSASINGRLLLDAGWVQIQTTGMSIGGMGQVEFGNSSGSTSYWASVGGGQSWTFGAGLTLRAIGHAQIGYFGNESWTNLGTIRAETTGRTLTITGGIQMNNRSRIEVIGGGRISAGTFIQNDAAAVTSIASGCTLQASTVDIQQGRLEGAGTIQGNLTNAGTIRPGGAAAAGTLTVTGTFSQGGGGRIEIELGGTTPGTGHDRLAVGGAATFGGALVASTLSGYVPPNPSQFDVVTYASRTGTLTFTPPGGVGMTPNYQATLLRLTVP